MGTPMKCPQTSHPGGDFCFFKLLCQASALQLVYHRLRRYEVAGAQAAWLSGDTNTPVNIPLGSMGWEWPPSGGHVPAQGQELEAVCVFILCQERARVPPCCHARSSHEVPRIREQVWFAIPAHRPARLESLGYLL